MADRPKLKEVLIVEGRDDTINVTRAVDCFTIETHGFGITRETWEEIARAYEEKGIIILTDPDHSGEEIRRKLTEAFPGAGQAYISRDDALRKGDIGVENAEPEVIIEALRRCRGFISEESASDLTMEDLFELGLAGAKDSARLRELAGKALGIGYANSKGFLRKLRGFGIKKEELYEALCTIDHQGDTR